MRKGTGVNPDSHSIRTEASFLEVRRPDCKIEYFPPSSAEALINAFTMWTGSALLSTLYQISVELLTQG